MIPPCEIKKVSILAFQYLIMNSKVNMIVCERAKSQMFFSAIMNFERLRGYKAFCRSVWTLSKLLNGFNRPILSWRCPGNPTKEQTTINTTSIVMIITRKKTVNNVQKKVLRHSSA